MSMMKIISGGKSFVQLLLNRYILRKNIRFTLWTEIKRNVEIITIGTGTIELGRSVHLFNNVQVKANNGATVTIGKHTSFNNGCMLISRKSIKVGENCSFGPNVMIYDHDHDFYTGKIKDDKYIETEIEIGSNVWVGAGAIILRGSKIGNNVVIGAGTVVKGTVQDGMLVYQKKETVVRPIVGK